MPGQARTDWYIGNRGIEEKKTAESSNCVDAGHRGYIYRKYSRAHIVSVAAVGNDPTSGISGVPPSKSCPFLCVRDLGDTGLVSSLNHLMILSHESAAGSAVTCIPTVPTPTFHYLDSSAFLRVVFSLTIGYVVVPVNCCNFINLSTRRRF